MAIPTLPVASPPPGGSAAAGGTTADITALSPQDNDIAIVAIECGSAATVAINQGYAAVTDSPAEPGADTELNVFWKRWTTGNTNPTFSGCVDHYHFRNFLVRGCTTSGDPWDVTAQNTNGGATSATLTYPGDTTTVADCLIVMLAADGIDASGTRLTTGLTNADLANLSVYADGGPLRATVAVLSSQPARRRLRERLPPPRLPTPLRGASGRSRSHSSPRERSFPSCGRGSCDRHPHPRSRASRQRAAGGGLHRRQYPRPLPDRLHLLAK